MKSVPGTRGVHDARRPGRHLQELPSNKSERTFLALGHHGRSSEASMKQTQCLPHVAGSISTHELAGHNGIVHMGQPTLKGFTRIGKITDHRHPELFGAMDCARDLPRKMTIDHQHNSGTQYGKIEIGRSSLHGAAIGDDEATISGIGLSEYNRSGRGVKPTSNQPPCRNAPFS
jgi:hypothetical protein